MEDRFTDQEKQLKALGDNFSIEIDTNDLWEKVESQLPRVEDEKRRPIVWWFVGGIAFVLLVAVVWNFQAKSNQGTEDVEHSAIIASSIEVAEVSKDKENTHTQTSADKANHSDKIARSDFGEIAPAKEELNSNSSSLFEEQKVASKPIQTEEILAIKQEIRPEKAITEPISENAVVNPVAEDNSSVQDEISNPVQTLISIASIPTQKIKTIQSDQMFDIPLTEIVPVQTASWLPFFALYSGVNTQQNFIQSNTLENLNLQQFEEEKPMLGWSSDLRLGLENAGGWRFGLGINHTRLANRFSRTEPDTVMVQIPGSVTSKIDGEGNTTNLDGELLQTTITNYNVNWHRIHDFVNLQLSVGKKLIEREKVIVFADASLSRNIWSNHTGYYFINGERAIQKFSEAESHPYTNSGYNFGLSMDVEYKINEFSISLRPFALIGLNSITQSSNYYQLKNSQYGVQLGIVYRP